jgi:SAM-dependent methyltransferase
MSTPPDYRVVGRHPMMPQTTHDEAARFNFLANLNRYLSANVLPMVKTAYEQHALPEFVAREGREPATRHEVRKLMQKQRAFQNWSALRRSTMELRQQAGRSVVLRQVDTLNAHARAAPPKLQPGLEVPRYISEVDQHCMPGGYATEVTACDVSAAANYDVGIFATTGGGLGRFSDGGGSAVVEWLQREHPQFKPARILDVGAGLGHNTLPLAQAYPDAEVIAVDVAAPMLRYGQARATGMKVSNVTFQQANAETLPFPTDSFDFVMTCMFLHETSRTAIERVLAEIYRVLRPGGISLHLEQPQYSGMPVYEQFVRDWDAYNNNEPFWTTMHDLDLRELAMRNGAAANECFETGLAAVVDASLFPPAPAQAEDYGRKAAWYAFGVAKATV